MTSERSSSSAPAIPARPLRRATAGRRRRGRRHDALAGKGRRRCAGGGIEPLVFDGAARRREIRAQPGGNHASGRVDRPRRRRRPGAQRRTRRDRPAHAGAALDRLSVDRRRLWRPWRRLGRRDRPNAGRSPRRSQMRVEAERHGSRFGERDRPCRWRSCGCPASTGPGRNAFVNLANGTARRLVKPDQVFNRIHVEDIAGALLASCRRRIMAASSTSPTTSRRRRRTWSPMRPS